MGASPRVRPERLALKLGQVREKLGLTQVEIAVELSDKAVVVTDKDISKWEKGERDPSLVVVLRYSRLIKVPMEVFADDKLDLP